MSKKIMLACAAGLSTSMMVEAMKKAATELGLEYEIWAEPISTAFKRVGEVDFVLLGPQVRFELDNFKKNAEESGTPVEVIDMKHYGMMDGKSVINSIKDKVK